MGNTAARQRRSRGRDLEAGVPGGAVRPDASVAATGRPTSGRIEPTARMTVRAPKVTPTATIRSLLNLKKHMLKLVPDETRAGSYRLSFSIDTAKACRVQIYVMAHEKPSKDGGPPRIKCKEKNLKIPSLPFGKGLEQAFVHAIGEGISFGAYKESDLTSTKGYDYPMIIRAVTEVEVVREQVKEVVKDAVKETPVKGETLKSDMGKVDMTPPKSGPLKSDASKTDLAKVEPVTVEPGKPEGVKGEGVTEEVSSMMTTPVQVAPEEPRKTHKILQAQTTYATLVKQPDGFYGINVIKQVIWVDGVSYVLHDIFGIDRSRDEKTSVTEDHSKQECVICLAENRDTLALPCRHLCMCSECAKALRYQTNKCPICRSELHSLLVINLGDTPAQLP